MGWGGNLSPHPPSDSRHVWFQDSIGHRVHIQLRCCVLVPKTWVLLASVFLRSETHSASYKIPSTFAFLCSCSHETLRCGSFRAMHALTIA